MKRLAAALLGLACALRAQTGAAAVETFTIREVFGVSHPLQIVDFDLHAPVEPGKTYVIGPEGREVPFQLLSGNRLAVETDLPAGTQKAWRLFTGRAPAAFPGSLPGGVEVKAAGDWYEIANGLTGVRVPRGAGASGLAPIQGVRYRDGFWTAAGPNYLLDLNDRRLAAGVPGVRFVERGRLKTVVELSYSFPLAELTYGNKKLLPGGQGYYRCTITVEADQPSLLIEEDTNADVHYAFPVSPGLDPDEARYRGHHSTSIANGYKADGNVYADGYNPPQDAIRKLRFDPPSPSSYTSSEPYLRRMAVWDPWVYDSGWYWQAYKAAAGPEVNLLGIFAGPASLALGAGNNGAGLYTARDARGGRVTGIKVELNRRAPDANVFPRVRLAWGLFAGVKGKDLSAPDTVQTVGRQMNLHSGVNLSKIHRYPLDVELKTAMNPLYMSAAAVDAMAARVHADEAYARHLVAAEPTATALVTFWRDDSEKRRAEILGSVTALSHNLVEALVNGSGIYDFLLHYWMGGLEMSRSALWINTILRSPDWTPEEKRSASAAAVLFGEVLWDDDFVPMFSGHGLNLGTANMPVQQRGYRDLYALLLADQPWMRNRVANVEKSALDDLHQTVSESGAEMGSTHYLEASMGPLLSTLQQIQTTASAQPGLLTDPFRTDPRLAAFGEFLINLLTPPEWRFGGVRKLPSIGDAATESNELFGQLATAFAKVNPDLSARLMWAWRNDGALHSGFHGTTILKIDEALPVKDPLLHDAHFPGWYSVLRHGWGTRDETALWFVNGDFYRDHAHEDAGNVVLYALGAPLSLDWGSMYYPPTSGAALHNAPVPEARLKTRWDGEPEKENLGFRWQGATEEAFESFPHAGYSRAAFHLEDGSEWTRSVTSIHADPGLPVIVIRDRFSGTDPVRPRVLSFNVTASGAVETPGGMVTPPSYAVQNLGPGLSRFRFLGAPQAGRLATDADIYTGGASQAVLGHWVNTWSPNFEAVEFRQANQRAFEEAQHILRLRGTNGFLLVILPRRHREERMETVTGSESEITVHAGDGAMTITPDSWTFSGPQGTSAGLFGAAEVSAGDMKLSGGAGELFGAPDGSVSVTLHGAPGQRTARWAGRSRMLDYAGGDPQTVVLQDRR